MNQTRCGRPLGLLAQGQALNVQRPTFKEQTIAITKNQDVVRSGASVLSSQLNQFKKYLATMPGRVEAFACGDHPDGDDHNGVSLGLKLHREGLDWIISYFSSREGDEEDSITFRPPPRIQH